VTGAVGINKVSSSNISKYVGAASRLVTRFLHSLLAELEMEQRQTSMGIKGDDGKPLKHIQHVKTRWNSVNHTCKKKFFPRFSCFFIFANVFYYKNVGKIKTKIF
jgi:hypothetical protein